MPSASAPNRQTPAQPRVPTLPTASKTILVTGANGLVGSALCRSLAQAGHQVFAGVRAPEPQGLGAIKQIQIPDLTDEFGQWPLNGIDVVVHTAARVHLMGAQGQDQAAYTAVNTEGTLRLAQACVKAQVKRLVFLSTVKVHGEQTSSGQPFDRDDPLAPGDPYAQSKAQAETQLFELAKCSDLAVTVVRPPLVYGRGARGNLQSLCNWIDRGWPLPIGALDQNRRSLVSLGNLVDLLGRCVEHPGAINQAFLVSDGHDVSTLALARAIAQARGRKLRAWRLPEPLLRGLARLAGRQAMIERLTQNLQVDISHTQAILDWQPPETLDFAMQQAFAAGPDA